MCARSISFPQQQPSSIAVETPAQPPKAPATTFVSCVQCRRKVSAVIGICPNCETVLVKAAGDGSYRLPPHVPPRLLECTCCREFKPQFAFGRMNTHHGKNREYKQHKCRGCQAFRARVKRESDGERLRAMDRNRATNRPRRISRPLTEAQRQAHLLSVKRYNARQQGRNVLKQRNGRQSILLKPICRVADTCPLKEFCTVEGKALA